MVLKHLLTLVDIKSFVELTNYKRHQFAFDILGLVHLHLIARTNFCWGMICKDVVMHTDLIC